MDTAINLESLKKYQFQLLIGVLLLPLFFINIRNNHDWGGDFSLYIKQAQNFVEGVPQVETGYILNPSNTILSPPTYPIGFPLVLSPIYYFFGNNILAFNYFQTFLLFLLSFITALFLKQIYRSSVAIFCVLITSYSWALLSLKAEIISDILFSFLFITSIYLYKYRKETVYKQIILGFIIGYSILTRSLGIVLLVPIGIEILENLFLLKKILFTRFITPLVAILIFVSFNFIFLGGFSTESHLLSVFDFANITHHITQNISYYLDVITWFFNKGGDWLAPIKTIVKYSSITFFVLGFIISCVKKRDYLWQLFLFYMLIIVSFPNSTQGFRYLLPVFPIILYFIIEGIKSITFPFQIKKSNFVITLYIIFGVMYIKPINTMLFNYSTTLSGPQKETSVELFNYIKANTKKDSKFSFIKPRVLALYTNRQSMAIKSTSSVQESIKELKLLQINYLVTSTYLFDDSMDELITKNPNLINLLFENSKFKIYELKF